MKDGKIRYNIKKTNKKSHKKLKMVILIVVIIVIGIIYFNDIKKEGNYSSKMTKMASINIDKINETSSFPEEVYGIPVHTQLIEEKTQARPGTKRRIKYIVIHETDNKAKGTGAKNHAEFLSVNNTKSTSWHYTVDDKEIYHHIPDNEIAHHAATKTGNLYGIGIELCVNEDGKFNKTFENATKLVAYLIKEYDLNIYDIKTHNDFSGKDCPHLILKNNRMEEFVKKVKKNLN